MDISVVQEGLSLALRRDNAKRKESLAITGSYPDNVLSRFLFAQLGLMHLVAPYEAEHIHVEFGISDATRKLIGEMYAWEKRRQPKIKAGHFSPHFDLVPTSRGRVAIAYSGGKDSMWNLWRASKRYGAKNVLAVHIRGLNQGQNSEEAEYSARQFKEFKVAHHVTIVLRNGSLNNGFNVMRSRDMFLVSLVIPHALEFGASRVLIEGFAEETADERFTGSSRSMNLFNAVLRAWAIPVRVAWQNRKEMDRVKDLYKNRPEWMPLVCNCFTRKIFKAQHRRTCERLFPTLPPYDSQCGLCIKCRIVNLGRVLYGSERITPRDVRAFLESTAKWIPTKLATHADMIEGSFLRDFKRALKIYAPIHPRSP